MSENLGSSLDELAAKRKLMWYRWGIALVIVTIVSVGSYFALRALGVANQRLMARVPKATPEQQKVCGAIWDATNITPTGATVTAKKFPQYRQASDPGVVSIFSSELLDNHQCAVEKMKQLAAHASPNIVVIYDNKRNQAILIVRNYNQN